MLYCCSLADTKPPFWPFKHSAVTASPCSSRSSNRRLPTYGAPIPQSLHPEDGVPVPATGILCCLSRLTVRFVLSARPACQLAEPLSCHHSLLIQADYPVPSPEQASCYDPYWQTSAFLHSILLETLFTDWYLAQKACHQDPSLHKRICVQRGCKPNNAALFSNHLFWTTHQLLAWPLL